MEGELEVQDGKWVSGNSCKNNGKVQFSKMDL